MPFEPRFEITSKIAETLIRIGAAREAVKHLPITPSVLKTLRETARLYSTHYSTMIEGNRLTQEQVSKVVASNEHFPWRERDEKEVLGYYAALERVENLAERRQAVTETQIQNLHWLVMAGGKSATKVTPYRDEQNVIRDSRSHRVVYMLPEAKDVPMLMGEMVAWFSGEEGKGLPCPLRAAIAHYQFATIHPYYDGNGRTARLLTTLILHLGGYDLKGLYSLEEYYARNLGNYYDAITIGPSHNYYMGRAESDITKWVDYFCSGMAESFEAVKRRAEEAAGANQSDQSALLRSLTPRQRKAIPLFLKSDTITSSDVEGLFSITQRAARNVLKEWVSEGFVIVTDAGKKTRKYVLAKAYRVLVAE